MEICRWNSVISASRRIAGLELFGRYLRTRRFNHLVRDAFADLPRWGDFGVVAMVRVLVGLVTVGGRRLRHVAYVADDPVFQRFGNVRVVPTARTLSRWLRHFTMRTVTRFQVLNAAVVSQLLPTLGLRTWTVDVDGVVVSDRVAGRTGRAGLQPAPAEGAQLLPDHGAPGRDDTHLAGQEPVGQRPRWEGRPAVLARPVAPAGGAAHRRGLAAVSHGWGVFSARCAAVAARPRRGLCHQSPVLSLVGSAGLHPGHPHLGPGGARRDRLRRAACGDAVADPPWP